MQPNLAENPPHLSLPPCSSDGSVFMVDQVYVCKATTLPDVLSEFWSLTADCAQANYQAISDDRDYAAHVLFVIPHCDLLKDYGMMRHLVREGE